MKNVLFILIQTLALNVFSQQKAMFSQYMFNPLIINPAYPAVDESMNITTVVRQQWVGFNGAPNTQTISVHSPLGSSNTFMGFTAFRDHIGEALTETGAFFTLAQRLKLSNKTYLSFGVNGGLSQYSETYSSIGSSVDMPDDPTFMDQNDTRFNFGAGIMLFSDKFYAGLSSPFLYTLDVNNNHSPFFTLQSGYIIKTGDDLLIKPNILGKYISGSPFQLDLNVNFLLKETVGFGISYRSMDSLDFLAEIFLSRKVSLGYSYDYSTTRLARAHSGSHEIMLNVRLPVAGHGFTGCYF
ncbi:type IX secretion system membrane protein PorP/SprF [Pedobacter sp. P351]|uniref:PorP/SprF family type IX secretion system membrane protein n=1 Tax=Pedobacter superstes TaxID=3133441 RepID=UPI0030A3DEFE